MNNRDLTILSHLCSASFPTGAFHHSYGLEYMIENGIIHDSESLVEAINSFLYNSLASLDAPLINIVSLTDDIETIMELDRLCTALKCSKEMRLASKKVGVSFLKMCNDMYEEKLFSDYLVAIKKDDYLGNFCVVYAMVCSKLNVDISCAINSYLLSTISSYVQVALKLIPLSQSKGQIIIKEMYGSIIEISENALKTTERESLNSFTPILDIASMNHEKMQTRLYMS